MHFSIAIMAFLGKLDWYIAHECVGSTSYVCAASMQECRCKRYFNSSSDGIDELYMAAQTVSRKAEFIEIFNEQIIVSQECSFLSPPQFLWFTMVDAWNSTYDCAHLILHIIVAQQFIMFANNLTAIIIIVWFDMIGSIRNQSVIMEILSGKSSTSIIINVQYYYYTPNHHWKESSATMPVMVSANAICIMCHNNRCQLCVLCIEWLAMQSLHMSVWSRSA